MHLIDSNIAIYFRDGDAEIGDKINALPARPVLSILTRVELEGGVHAKPEFVTIRRQRLDALMQTLEVLPLDHLIAAAYGSIIASCGYSRRRILDRLIAATAIVHDLTLITINSDDFRDIPGLKLEVWAAPPQ